MFVFVFVFHGNIPGSPLAFTNIDHTGIHNEPSVYRETTQTFNIDFPVCACVRFDTTSSRGAMSLKVKKTSKESAGCEPLDTELDAATIAKVHIDWFSSNSLLILPPSCVFLSFLLHSVHLLHGVA